MYSDKLEELFKKQDIKVGDKIGVKSKESDLKGELMPKTEVGDPNTLILKLENGYNIGVNYSKELSITKISTGKSEVSFPKSTLKSQKGLPEISLIYTGGTIGSKVDYKTGGVYMLLKPEELFHEVPELSSIANIKAEELFSIASDDITFIEWQKIAEQAANVLNKGARGIVITMGTDTMHYTAAALSFMLQNLNAPIVITGAQRSSDRGSSDAFFNLACSAQIAARSDIAEVGICMHWSSSDRECAFIRGNKARKMHTSRRDAFRPINGKPIATIDSSFNIKYNEHYNKVENKKKKIDLKKNFEEKVALVKISPNSDPEIIDFYIGKNYKGIILEGTGLGHAPVSTEHKNFNWIPAIKRATDKGIVVGMSSQCIYGRVHESVYGNARILSNAGVVYCNDMHPETAYVKLGWLLGNYKQDKVRELLGQNIAGEISERSQYDDTIIEF